jgi:hypothetical protein
VLLEAQVAVLMTLGQLHASQNGLAVLRQPITEQILVWEIILAHLAIQALVSATVGVKNQLVQLVHHLLEQKLAHH